MQPTMVRPKPGIGKGVLDPRGAQEKFTVARFHPSADLEPFIEHLWTVSWNLGEGPPHVQETLPDPSVHIVLERGASEVVGVLRGKFARRLVGAGQVFAAKLHPGGFYPFVREPVVNFTDRRVALAEVFDVDVQDLEARLFGAADEASMATELEGFLRAQGAEPDPNVALVRGFIARISSDPAITKVAQLGGQARALQRLFRRYVGVSPKWVIRRSRLQNAAESLAARAAVDLVDLAARLGYADQAHFVRDFRTLVGTTPGAYARRNLGGS